MRHSTWSLCILFLILAVNSPSVEAEDSDLIAASKGKTTFKRYCSNCHEDTRLKNDPVDIPHATLIDTERWDTCLGCHDFHGNHEMEVARRVHDAIPVERIELYFQGESSPYGAEKHYASREEPWQ